MGVENLTQKICVVVGVHILGISLEILCSSHYSVRKLYPVNSLLFG